MSEIAQLLLVLLWQYSSLLQGLAIFVIFVVLSKQVSVNTCTTTYYMHNTILLEKLRSWDPNQGLLITSQMLFTTNPLGLWHWSGGYVAYNTHRH